MPGVFEISKASDDNSPTSNISNEIPAEQEENNHAELASNVEEADEDEPTRELTQTDKINRHLLKSFLEHMNGQQFGEQQTPNEESSEGGSQDDADW